MAISIPQVKKVIRCRRIKIKVRVSWNILKKKIKKKNRNKIYRFLIKLIKDMMYKDLNKLMIKKIKLRANF